MMNRITKDAFRRMCLTGLFALFACFLSETSRAEQPTDIERNFLPVITRDLSGTYISRGSHTDTNEYFEETITLTFKKKFNTVRGSVFKYYTCKSTMIADGTVYSGIAVDDGTRLYYITIPTNVKSDRRIYILLLGKLVLPEADRAALVNYYQMNENAESGVYYEWKKGAPWYGYFEAESDAFGYIFQFNGEWCEFSLRGCGGFPLVINDTGRYRILELKENGTQRKKNQYEKLKYYHDDERDSWVAEANGETIFMSSLRFNGDSKSYYWDYYGTGFMTAHPRTGDSVYFGAIGGPDGLMYGYVEESGDSFTGKWSIMDNTQIGNIRWVRQAAATEPEKK